MTGTITASQARAVIRRGRCAACGGSLVAVDHGSDGHGVACFACGREVATVAPLPPTPFDFAFAPWNGRPS